MVETTLIAYHEATRELVVIEGVIAPPFLFLISKTVIHSEEGGGGAAATSSSKIHVSICLTVVPFTHMVGMNYHF